MRSKTPQKNVRESEAYSEENNKILRKLVNVLRKSYYCDCWLALKKNDENWRSDSRVLYITGYTECMYVYSPSENIPRLSGFYSASF